MHACLRVPCHALALILSVKMEKKGWCRVFLGAATKQVARRRKSSSSSSSSSNSNSKEGGRRKKGDAGKGGRERKTQDREEEGIKEDSTKCETKKRKRDDENQKPNKKRPGSLTSFRSNILSSAAVTRKHIRQKRLCFSFFSPCFPEFAHRLQSSRLVHTKIMKKKPNEGKGVLLLLLLLLLLLPTKK